MITGCALLLTILSLIVSLFLAFKNDLFVTKFKKCFEKAFHEARFLRTVICEVNLFYEQIRGTRAIKLLINGIQCDKETKLLNFTYNVDIFLEHWYSITLNFKVKKMRGVVVKNNNG